jgi:hypothetical protein
MLNKDSSFFCNAEFTLLLIMSQYSEDISLPIQLRLILILASDVVPLPLKQS